MDPAEIEFLAESASSIGIVPNFSEGTLYLLEGDVGPFRAGQPLQVWQPVCPPKLALQAGLYITRMKSQPLLYTQYRFIRDK